MGLDVVLGTLTLEVNKLPPVDATTTLGPISLKVIVTAPRASGVSKNVDKVRAAIFKDFNDDSFIY
jgi:hypothetical protein